MLDLMLEVLSLSTQLILGVSATLILVLAAVQLTKKKRQEETVAPVVFNEYSYHYTHGRFGVTSSVTALIEYEGKIYTANLGSKDEFESKKKKRVAGLSEPTKLILTYHSHIFTQGKEYLASVKLVEDDIEFNATGLQGLGLSWPKRSHRL